MLFSRCNSCRLVCSSTAGTAAAHRLRVGGQAGVNLATETAIVQVMLPEGTPAQGHERDRCLRETAELLAQVQTGVARPCTPA